MNVDQDFKGVSIVIPNWNGKKLLADYFDSVIKAAEFYREHSGSNVEVIVVDDASTDGSREWLSDNFAGHAFVRIIELETNVGFLRAVNHGFAHAKYPIVFLLNNDVSVEHDSIMPLVGHFEDERVFAVCCRADRIVSGRLDGGGKLGSFERGHWRVFLNYEIAPNAAELEHIEYYSFYGSGGYTAYDREKLTILGGFQDCLAPIYWEDVEICYRAWKRGWVVKYEPQSGVHHLGSATMGKEKMRSEMAVITERNRLIMTWINLHDRRWMAAHIFLVLMKSAGSLLTFRLTFLKSLFGALSRFTAIQRARHIERNSAKMSDRWLAEMFADLALQKNIFIVRDIEDERKLADLRKNLPDLV